MASIGAINTVIGKLTKKMYQDGLPDMFITEAPYVSKRRKKPLPLGTDMTRGYNAAWQEGLGIAADTDNLPTPSAPVFRNPTFDAVDIYNVLQLTAKEIERTKGNNVAIAQYLKTVMSGASKNFWRDMEFRCFNDATGQRCITSGAVQPGTSVTITASAAGIPLRGLRVNSKLQFYNETTSQLIDSGMVITSLNISAGTFVVDVVNNAIPTASGVYLDAKGERNGDINGLVNLVNDSTGNATVLGLSSSLSDWQSLVLSNSAVARNITFQLLDTAYYRSLEQDGSQASEAWMDYIQLRKLIALAQRNIMDPRSDGKTLKLNTHNEVEFLGTAKVNPSSYAPAGKIYNLVADDLSVDQMRAYSPVHIDGDDGAVWERIPGTTKYEAVWWWSGNHTCEQRRLHTLITDLVAS